MIDLANDLLFRRPSRPDPVPVGSPAPMETFALKHAEHDTGPRPSTGVVSCRSPRHWAPGSGGVARYLPLLSTGRQPHRFGRRCCVPNGSRGCGSPPHCVTLANWLSPTLGSYSTERCGDDSDASWLRSSQRERYGRSSLRTAGNPTAGWSSRNCDRRTAGSSSPGPMWSTPQSHRSWRHQQRRPVRTDGPARKDPKFPAVLPLLLLDLTSDPAIALSLTDD